MEPLSWNFGNIPIFGPSQSRPLPLPFFAQAKLKIGRVDDPLEREADQIADRVLQTVSPPSTIQAAPIQAQRKCTGCAKEEEETLRKKSDASSGPTALADTAPPVVTAALAGAGTRMDTATRSFFEPRFGHSLADIRIHSDGTAARSAEAVAARAYTVGRDIVFAPGQYSPGTFEGRKLLAHEIAHVVQQSGGRSGTAVGRDVIRRQPDGKMTPSPAPAPGVTPPVPAAPPAAAPDLGSQDPGAGKLAPPENPVGRRVQSLTFDCGQKLLVVDAGADRLTYKLETCSLPVGFYEPTVTHEGNNFSLNFHQAASSKERFDFSYFVKPGQVNPALLLAKQDKVDVEVVNNLPAPKGAKKTTHPDAPPDTPSVPPCVVHLADRQLVKPDSGSRALFKPIEVNQTVWSHAIPLGEFGFVDVDAKITGDLSGTLSGRYGPGDLTDICLTHQIDQTASSAPINHPLVKGTSHADVSTFVIGGRARFKLPASASVVIQGSAALEIAADYLKVIKVGSLKGGFNARGEAALGGSFDAMVDIIARFTRSAATLNAPFGNLSIEISKASLDKIDLAAQVSLQGHASLAFGLDAFAAVKFLGFELWRENWKLRKAANLGLGWEGGIKYSPNPGIHWILGAIDQLEGIDDELFDDDESYVDTEDVLGTLLNQSRGTQITPDGLSKQTALPFTWRKPLDFYPETLAIPNAEEPKQLHRDDGPTSVRRNVRGKSVFERIGVGKENWVGVGKFLQYVPHAVEKRSEQGRLQGLLTTLGFDNGGTEIDHVRDLNLGGEDEFRNLWPLDQPTNSAAGSPHRSQLENYRQQFAARGEVLDGRLFVISDVRL